MRTHQALQKQTTAQQTNTPIPNPLASRPFAVQPTHEEIERSALRSSASLSQQPTKYQSTLGNFAILNPEGGQAMLVQPKLAIGQVGDKYEQEADQVAQQVVQRLNAPQSPQLQKQPLQRQKSKESSWHGNQPLVKPGMQSFLHIQRKMNFNANDLCAEASFKGKIFSSSFSQIQATLTAYWQTKDVNEEIKLMEKMKALIDTWNKHRETDQEGDANTVKSDRLTELQNAIDEELPIARAIQQREQRIMHLVKAVGIAREYLVTLPDKQLDLLIGAYQALGNGDVATADANLSQVKTSIGDIVNPLKSFLIRHHIEKVNPELAKIMNPEFKLNAKSNQNVLKQAETHIQDAMKTGLDEMEAQGDDVAKQKAKMMRPSHSDLAGKATDTQQKKQEFKVLEPAEVIAITGYTTDFYGKINTPLRQDAHQLDAGPLAWAQAGVSGLNKLPKFKGTVFRHLGKFTGYSALNQPGAIVSDLAFSSSAVNQASCASAGKSHEVLEIIQSKTGREISAASLFGKESEVLFRPGTQFKVVGRGKKGTDGVLKPENKKLQKYLDADTKKDQIEIVIYKEEV
jgi:hypothetical protein